MSARAGSFYELIADLRLRLPALWKKAHTVAASHTPNIIHVEYGTFDYICDFYSGMEALGEVAFDQRVRDRVVGVLGISLPMRGRRLGSLPKGWVEHPAEVDRSGRDKGHFIAHAIGGGLDMNLFSQARGLNRGIPGLMSNDISHTRWPTDSRREQLIRAGQPCEKRFRLGDNGFIDCPVPFHHIELVTYGFRQLICV